MKSTFARSICRILVASMMVLPLQAQAGLIGTDQATRAALGGFIGRAEVAGQLQNFGLSPEAANERVAALTDAEVATLAGQIERLPAGADGGGVGILLVILFLFWRFVLSDQAQAEAGKAAPKPAPKPAPEKK